MLQVDVLSGFLICGLSSLVAAALLRLAQTDEAVQRQALNTCGRAFVVLGLALLPAGMGEAVVALPPVQLSLTAGSLIALVLLARGLSLLHGRPIAPAWLTGSAVAASAACAGMLVLDPLWFGKAYAALLFAAGLLLLWSVRGFVRAPRDTAESLVGATMLLLTLSTGVRVAVTLLDEGAARVDLVYGPPALVSAFAALYAVMPMLVAALLLNLLHTRLQWQLKTRAQTDELTGVLTRRALRELAPVLVEAAPAGRGELAVLMIDIDHFKQVNDTHGHAAGDEVLRELASILRAQMRADGLLARYGGEEFVALLPVDDASTARRVAERMRGAIEGTDWQRRAGVTSPVTISIGVAMVGARESLDAALQRADEALYRAKHGGRNQCQMSLRVA